jgi:hypothetical protein
MALFFIAANQQEETTIREIINTCTEYSYLIRMNQLKEKVKSVSILRNKILGQSKKCGSFLLDDNLQIRTTTSLLFHL